MSRSTSLNWPIKQKRVSSSFWKSLKLLYVYLFCEWKFSKSNLLYFVTKISVKSQKTQDQAPKKAGKKIKSNEKLVETAGETADETTAAEETAEEETEFEEDPGNQHLVHSEVMSENYKSNKLESVFFWQITFCIQRITIFGFDLFIKPYLTI